MHLEKSVVRLQITAFKNCSKWTPVYKDYWRWKVYILNKCSYFNWKKSNQDWNTPIHIESNGQHIKVPLIFWFFIMIFYICFYHQLWVKWLCLDIGNSSGHIVQTHSQFRKICGCFALNEMNIRLTSLIIFLINDNLINMSSPPEGKKTVLYIAHLIILSTSKETSIY